MAIRQPILAVLGHVDHGKTSLLDAIRQTTVAAREAGQITQYIGATEVPLSCIKTICTCLKSSFNINFQIPGLLVIDTPGHEAFSNLRERGGAIADLAILVIDINQGVQPQTKEAIQILRHAKTPFVIALTKIDMINKWRSSQVFCDGLKSQSKEVQDNFYQKFYKVLEQLSQEGLNMDLYFNIQDYTKTIAAIPVSSKTKEGLAELLSLICGLSQKFLTKSLQIQKNEPASGAILEVKETKGLGTTIDVIIDKGEIKQNDELLFLTPAGPKKTKIKALFRPTPLKEIRDEKTQFTQISSMSAAAGLKLVSPAFKDALSGSPIFVIRNKEQEKLALEDINKAYKHVLIQTQEEGIIIKADTLGSLEAINTLLIKKQVPIRKAFIGEVTKKDVVESQNLNQELQAILAFNVDIPVDVTKLATEYNVFIAKSKIVYDLLDKYDAYVNKIKELRLKEQQDSYKKPCKIKILSKYIFRRTSPAIFGAEILLGNLKPESELVNQEGEIMGVVKNIQEEKTKLEEGREGQQLAISVQGPINIGRNAQEDENLYVQISQEDYKFHKNNISALTPKEKQALEETKNVLRKKNAKWALEYF